MEGVFFLGICGLVFLVVDVCCIRKLVEYFRLKKHGVACEATVISADIRSYRGQSFLYPMLEFTTADGKAVVVMGKFGTSTRSVKYRVGAKVRLFYEAEDPKHYVIVPDDLYGWIATVFLCTFFLILFAGCSIGFLVDILTR